MAAIKQGWEDAGNNLVRNTATGQMVDQNHPTYLNDGVSGASQSSYATPSSEPLAAPSAIPAAPSAAPAAPKNYTPQEAAQLGLGWVDTNNPNYGKAGYVGSETASQAPVGTQPGGAGGTTPVPGGQPQTINDAFRTALLGQLNTSPDVSLNDPTLKPQSDAFALSQQRSQERSQNMLAEQGALEGTNTSGGFTSDKLGLEQGRAQAEGAFNADLVGRELQNRRGQLMQALQMGAGYLSDQEHQALQKQLADLDAAIRREGISSQSQIAAGDLGFRNRALDVQSNLGLLQALMGNEQAGNQLGFNYAQLQTGANRDALLAALGL